MQRKEFASLHSALRQQSDQRFDLKDLLWYAYLPANMFIFYSIPMQRLVKYPLLLTELLKFTPVGHPQRDAISEALGNSQVWPCRAQYSLSGPYEARQ